MPAYPNTIKVDPIIRDCFELLVEQQKHNASVTFPDGVEFPDPKYGSGRTVYDISQFTDTTAVIKIASNAYGLNENRQELHQRQAWPHELQERLVPCVDAGHSGHWVIQPKISTTLSQQQQTAAVAELTVLVEKHGGDPREVYPDNVGIYDDVYVIYDHGGL